MEGNLHRMAFNQHRGLQGNQTASILRYTESGGNIAHGIAPTKTLVSGLADLPVLVDDFTVRVAEVLGEEFRSGRKLFEFADVQVLTTDFVTWDSRRWKVENSYWDSTMGVCQAVCAREE